MTANRPLSPHLQIYRPQITSVLSIAHRIAGVAMGLGTLLLTWWLVAAAIGPGAYAYAQAFWGSLVGKALLLGWSLAFFYHLANGLRHLVWDMGWGLSLRAAKISGVLVIFLALGLTALAWIGGYCYAGTGGGLS